MLGGVLPSFDLSSEEARAKFVPAAAVRRTVRTLFGITGLKGCVGGAASLGVKSLGSTEELRSKLPCSREIEVMRNFRWSGEMR